MAKVRICDLCKREIKTDEEVQIIEIKQYVESDEIPKESNPDMVRKDACSECAELNAYGWDKDENIKAMFLSIKQRRSRVIATYKE